MIYFISGPGSWNEPGIPLKYIDGPPGAQFKKSCL